MKTKNVPSPDTIRAAREAARLSQSEAAALVHATRRTWQNWESPIGSGNHRAIDPAAWELFEGKAARAVEAFERVMSTESIVASAVHAYPGLRKAMNHFKPTRKEAEAAERFFNPE